MSPEGVEWSDVIESCVADVSWVGVTGCPDVVWWWSLFDIDVGSAVISSGRLESVVVSLCAC